MPTPSLIPRVLARLRRRKPRPLILMYHRVARVRHDPWGIAVDPEHFEEQIEYVERHRTAMSMDELVQRLHGKTLPEDAVAVTFDDGYRDNLVNAKPILARHGVPACLFLPTGYVDRNVPFWWDELADMILASRSSAHCAQVCGGETIILDWLEADSSDAEASPWRAWDEPRTARQRAYVAIWRILQHLPEKERDSVMDSLRLRFETTPDPLAMPMNADEVRAFLEGGLTTLGAHGVTHAPLTSLSRLESQREIALSGQQCRSLTTERVSGFAYPHGDMNLEVQGDVAALGFSWACSTEGAWLDGEQLNMYALPRIAVPNAPMQTYIRLMKT
jgi:peptidoglycan/xylan/chitin deacetylase (PgdA/CDA1 family)